MLGHRSIARVGRTSLMPAASADDVGHPLAVELEEVVRCGDEPPFRAARRASAALEAADLAVELQLTEDGFDRGLALAVERAAVRGGEHAAHEVVEAAGP